MIGLSPRILITVLRMEDGEVQLVLDQVVKSMLKGAGLELVPEVDRQQDVLIVAVKPEARGCHGAGPGPWSDLRHLTRAGMGLLRVFLQPQRCSTRAAL